LDLRQLRTAGTAGTTDSSKAAHTRSGAAGEHNAAADENCCRGASAAGREGDPGAGCLRIN
jgi:hypothetical protein